MTARLVGPLALLLLQVVGGRAAAAVVPPLELTIVGCERYDEARLRALISIEMGTIAARGAAPAEASASARLACVADHATIEVVSGPAVPAARVELDLGAAAPATRLRLLALTLTELVAQSWAEAPATPRASPPPAPAPVDVVAATPPPAVAAPRTTLFVGTSARRMARPATWLAGVDVGVARALGSVAALVADVRAETGEGQTAIARVGWRQVTLTGALALGVTRARWAAHAAPGWSVGYASLTGRPDAPDARGASLGGTWSGPSLALRGRYALGRSGFIAVELASGFVTRRVVGLVDGAQPIFEVRGAWALAGLAGGLTF